MWEEQTRKVTSTFRQLPPPQPIHVFKPDPLLLPPATMTRGQTVLLYGIFAFAAPIGILAGADARELLRGDAVVVVKAITLSLASGVFLYMSTMHEFHNAPLIRHCATPRGFALMLAGLLLTVGVRIILGLAHAA